ncbi:unnamed protein product [Rotaria sordida]|uniref:Uncharacterized protein n=1 Tax=Rotaria sordida TaxID=392033 RepID=A0A819DER9_9BILA|nr:unnamed protein product [Rotaria sordida]
MHSTKLSSSSTTKPSPTTNIEQYNYPPISTLRRASRPSNIDLSIFDHNNTQQSSTDPGIYSAPIFYIKQTNNNNNNQQQQQQQQHISQTSQSYTTTFQFQPQQHLQLSPHHHHHHHSQQHNIHLYQQQQIVDPYHQHTPHTFPLPASPNHNHPYFYFPPSTLQVNMTSNSHQSTNTNQPSTPTNNNHLCSVQIEEPQQQQQQWSNPALSSLIVKRMNENSTSIPIDDDEDPSASIDALVADVDSNSHDLLDDEQNKSINESKTSSTIPTGTISTSSHLYLRSKSHILTTPPNPLASDDHPDNQLTVGNNYQKTFSPIPSAGFDLTTTTTTNNNNNNNNNAQLSSTKGTSSFIFDTNILEQNELKNPHNENLVDNNEENNHDFITKPLIINTDIRTTRISSNSLIQDDNSNHSSTNSSSHNTSSRIYSQILKSSEQQILSSSSPLSNDIKLSSLDHDNNQTNINSISLQQQQSRHYCSHPDCNKTFTNKSALAKHKLTHSQDRKHVCLKCNKGFKRLDHLNGHMLTHEEEKPHKCRVPNCNRTYCDARSLKRHIENTHQDILAAIHEGGHDEYRKFLPETAFVKTKDLSIHNEFSIDSIDSNSPRSLIDNEQSFNNRTSTGSKSMTTYTFDEEKCIECQICKKTFKNGAALNGHMRLHGGFIDKSTSSLSLTENTEKKKRLSTTIKRKRINSPSISIKIKKEEQDISMIPSTNNIYQSQSSFTNLSSCSNIISKHLYNTTLLSPARPSSSSSPNNSISTTPFSQYTIKNPLNVQSSIKQNRTSTPLSTHVIHPSRMNIQNVMIPHDPMVNPQIYLNTSSPLQLYDEKIKEPLLSENYSQRLQANGMSLHHSYVGSLPYQSPSHIPQYPIHSSSPSSSIPASLLYRILPNVERFKPDFCLPQQISSPLNESVRYTQSSHFGHLSVQNPTSLMINTSITSPYSNQTISYNSPLSPSQKCNKDNNNIQLSPNTHSTSSSCSSLSSSNIMTSQKQIQYTMKQEIQDYNKQQQIYIENQTSPLAVLEIVPDIDSPIKKNTPSAFLIGTPSSSTGTNSSSSSSTSTNTHFNYDNIQQIKRSEPTQSSFYWPSQLRRQLSLNLTNKTLDPLPSTPYTPPPMLSPFRKGPGLYYRVFSQPGTSTEPPSIPTTPLPPYTPIGEESAGPKINIGKEYQAIIPKCRTKLQDDDDEGSYIIADELLFSPTDLLYLDEKSLEKFEQLNRMNPFLFSSRHSPKSYPIELIYMLLYEYNGDLSRTLAALLDGTVNDIKQCRPLHNYHFLDCNKWTKEEIDAFTKAIQTSEKNFELVSRAVGTKSVKQCIEFHYMPKISITARKIVSTRTSSVMTRRKRFQLTKVQQQQQQLDDEISSSSSFSEFRFDDDGSTVNSDSSPATQFSCDIDECLQTFTTERACRAHRKNHRRTNNNMTSLTVTKRSRNID